MLEPLIVERRTTTMRPLFHFTADGWINDPHAITYAAGTYHHFFQYVPGSAAWDLACSWGHASGQDLFSLTELPPALTPGDGDDGVWSGSLIMRDEGGPQILYTSVSRSTPSAASVRTATPLDSEWLRWKKGPVVVAPPVDSDVSMFRDPSIVRDGLMWRMVVGAGFTSGTAAALGYASIDGVTWSEDRLVASRSAAVREPVWSGTMWECPQIIEVDGHHALIVSVWDKDVLYDVLYALGTYENGEFLPKSWGRLSHGESPYAATTFHDDRGQPCVMFWLRGVRGAGWTGAHSIPYRLRIADGRLRLTPHADIENYHAPSDARSTAADILWPAAVDSSIEVTQAGQHIVTVNRDEQELQIDLGPAGLHRVAWEGDTRIILDGPIIEVSSDAGVFASAIVPLEHGWSVTAPGLLVRGLVKEARS